MVNAKEGTHEKTSGPLGDIALTKENTRPSEPLWNIVNRGQKGK